MEDTDVNMEECIEISVDVCRICFTACKLLKSLFHCTYLNELYSDIYEELTGFKVEKSEELPTRICDNCEQLLLQFFDFKTKIASNEQILQTCLENPDVEEIQEQSVEFETNNDINNDIIIEEEVVEESAQFEDFENIEDSLTEDGEEVEETEVTVEGDNAEDDGYIHGFVKGEGKGLECVNCGPSCEIIDEVNRTRIDKTYRLKCGVCSKYFKNRRCFTRHYIHIHKCEKKFACRHCDEKFIHWATRSGHEANQHGVGFKFECPKCQKQFYRKDRFDKHDKVCWKLAYPFIECEICFLRFRLKKSYLNHIESAHKNATEEENRIVQERIKAYAIKGERMFREKNVEEETKEVYEIIEATETEDGDFEERLEDIEKVCTELKTESLKTTDNTKDDKEDMSTSKTEMLVKVEDIGELKGEMVEIIESTERRYSCKKCDKLFKTAKNLQKHIDNVHKGHKEYVCKCGAEFAHRTTYQNHMVEKHGAKKPFECPYCDYSCFKRVRFNAHVAKHEDPDKEYECPLCNQKFKSYTTMTIHRAKHKSNGDYECDVCKKQFIDKRNMERHYRLHTGENLYHCSVCLRGFNRKDHLQKHLQNVHKSQEV